MARKKPTQMTKRQLDRWARRLGQTPRARRVGRLSKRISLWLQRAGLAPDDARAHISIDLVDIFEATNDIRNHLRAMLRQDPSTMRGARVSAKHATGIDVVASFELLHHVRRLCRNWEKRVSDALYRRAETRSRRRAAA